MIHFTHLCRSKTIVAVYMELNCDVRVDLNIIFIVILNVPS